MALTFRCWRCQAVAWQGGVITETGDYNGIPVGTITVPDGSTLTITAKDIWAGFADISCPQGGQECPNTTAAWQARLAQQPTTAAEHQALRDADTALTARIEQIGRRGEEIGTRGEQIGTRGEQIGARLDQVTAAYDSQLATLNTQITALQSRKPVMRISPSVSLAAMTLGAVRDITFSWPGGMPSTTYDVTTNNTQVTVAVKSRTTTSAVLTLTATAAITATTIVAVAVGWA